MSDVEKNTVGRPSKKVADRIAMDEILISKEKREALVSQLKRLSSDKEMQKLRADSLREDVKATAENFNLSTAKFNSLISDYNSGELQVLIDERTSYVDMLTVIKEVSDAEA